jgi:hypothetical protein
MKKLMIAALSSMVALGAFAEPATETKAFQASLTPDIAIQDKGTKIEGVALSIWGENEQTAFAFGFVNGSTGDSAGFSWGLVNYADNYTGVQWAAVNYTKGSFVGWQGGMVNLADSMKGLQWGAVNIAQSMTGLQLGYVNYAETAQNGVQVGLVNIISDNEWFSDFPDDLAQGMVLVNWSFK